MIKKRFPSQRKGSGEKIYFISLMRLTTNGKTEGKMEKTEEKGKKTRSRQGRRTRRTSKEAA